jgi:hypothetical protein
MKSYHLKPIIMKKIIVLIFICFFSSLNSETQAASIEKKKIEFHSDLNNVKQIENPINSTPFLSKLSYKTATIDQDGSCTVVIYVYGPLGEPLGTFEGTSWISCDLALSYALSKMLEVFQLD